MPESSSSRKGGKLPPGVLAKRAIIVFAIYMVLMVSYIKIKKAREAGPGELIEIGPRQRIALPVSADPADVLEIIAAGGAPGGQAREHFHKGWTSQQGGDFLTAADSFRRAYAVTPRDRTKACFQSAWNSLFDDLDERLVQIRADFAAWRHENVIVSSKDFVETGKEILKKGWLDSEEGDRGELADAVKEAEAYGALAKGRAAASAEDWDECRKQLEAVRKRLDEGDLPPKRKDVLDRDATELEGLLSGSEE